MSIKLYPWIAKPPGSIAVEKLPDDEYYVIERRAESGDIVLLDKSPIIALIQSHYSKDNCAVHYVADSNGLHRVCLVWSIDKGRFGLLFLMVLFISALLTSIFTAIFLA